MAEVGILVLFLILEWKCLVIHYWVWYELWVFHIWPLLCGASFLIFLVCWMLFLWNDVAFCQTLFLHRFRWSRGFLPFVPLVWCVPLTAGVVCSADRWCGVFRWPLVWCVPLTAFHVLDRPCPTGINPAGHGAQPFQDAVEFSLLVFFWGLSRWCL